MLAPRRVRAVMQKELRVLLRDRFYLFMALLLPVVTMVIMGYGLTYDVKGLPLGVVDLDQSAESRRFIEAFTVSGYFRPVMRAWSADAIEEAMQVGRIRTGIVIPPGFARTLLRGQPVETQILIDASFPTRADIARGYAEAIVAQFNHERLEALAKRMPGGIPASAGLDVISRIWFNPTLESKNFMVPGLVVISLVFWGPIVVTLSVAREKETGAILNIQTAPLARWEFVAGKVLPYAAMSFVSFLLLVLASMVLFRVPLKGSVGLLVIAGLVFVLAMTALGLLISILARTQVAALLLGSTIVMTVGVFYSGWLSPVSTLDEAGRAVSRLLPTADFMTLVRGVFLKGLGVSAYRGTLLTLGIYVVVFAFLSIVGFQKRRR